jgi:hypothetical protein
MTYVGKILVIVIMVFSLVFLTLSTVVFVTERDWKKEVDKLKGDLSKSNGLLNTAKGEKADLEGTLKAQEDAAKQAQDDTNKQINQLKDEIAKRQEEITKQRQAVETSGENVRLAQLDADAKTKDIEKARQLLRDVQLETAEYKKQEKDLKDEIFNLRRELTVAKDNNKYLRESMVTLQNVIQGNGLDPNPEKYSKIKQPPEVDGEIVKGDAANRRFQISLGSDDGIGVGVELFVYRLQPKAEYLGKVKVQAVDNDQSVVTVIGTTPQGKKIREGDIVSTKIGPRL